MKQMTRTREFGPRILAACLLLGAAAGCTRERESYEPREEYVAVAGLLESFIDGEMEAKDLPALSIALIDDQEIVWARGFGFADPSESLPANEHTVYRVGSVSKLFTDVAVMQLVERGELDLDAPIARYLPDFQPANPFGGPVTLRQLMSHRSGLVREPPLGNYFDPDEPSLAATVASLNSTALVYPPENRIKYSNAAIGTVGYVLEVIQGEPFAAYVKRAVLEPLGMMNSAFEPEPGIVDDLATAYMWTYDGREFEAPTFQLGMAPAGSMYSTVLDLGGFMSMLFAGGTIDGQRILRQETLEEMWTPQFARPGAGDGYGIGFALSELQGHRRVGHGGAIYGFATSLAALPDERLGVVAVTSRDGRVAQRLTLPVVAPGHGVRPTSMQSPGTRTFRSRI